MKHAASTTVRAPRRLTEIEFAAWIGQATPGERIEYHRGFLAVDTVRAVSRLPEKERAALARLAARAWWAAELDLVHLVQHRLAPDRFAYVAVARARPRRAAVSLSVLLLENEAA